MPLRDPAPLDAAILYRAAVLADVHIAANGRIAGIDSVGDCNIGDFGIGAVEIEKPEGSALILIAPKDHLAGSCARADDGHGVGDFVCTWTGRGNIRPRIGLVNPGRDINSCLAVNAYRQRIRERARGSLRALVRRGRIRRIRIDIDCRRGEIGHQCTRHKQHTQGGCFLSCQQFCS